MDLALVISALALGLAMDAFAVAVAQGAAGHRSGTDALRIGAAFGFAQGAMPWFGWLLGSAFVSQIAAVDHWLVLALLTGLGLKMLWEARGADDEASSPRLAGWALAAAAVATSIDALAAGIAFPALGLPVIETCLAIGLVTAALSAAGVVLGGLASRRIGKWAEIAGGLVLIALGVRIFVDHQFFGG